MIRLLALLAVLAATPAVAAEPSLPRAEIERIVREYLLREPEVLYQALQELQTRRETAASERQRAVVAERRREIFDNPADPVIGDPQGDVTLVEFFDYRCGYCRTMTPTLRQLLEQDGKLRLVMKEFPILGPESVIASQAALAAQRQGKYREMHFALLEAESLTQDSIMALARREGLDPERLAADMESGPVRSQLEANLKLAETLGVTGTPAFLIGDQVIPGATDLERLTQLVEEQRAAAD